MSDKTKKEEVHDDDNYTPATPGRPTKVDAQLDNMPDVDMNTIRKEAGTHKDQQEEKENKDKDNNKD